MPVFRGTLRAAPVCCALTLTSAHPRPLPGNGDRGRCIWSRFLDVIDKTRLRLACLTSLLLGVISQREGAREGDVDTMGERRSRFFFWSGVGICCVEASLRTTGWDLFMRSFLHVVSTLWKSSTARHWVRRHRRIICSLLFFCYNFNLFIFCSHAIFTGFCSVL